MIPIHTPSREHAARLIASLEQTIVADIKRAVHDAMYNRIPVDWNIAEPDLLKQSFTAISFLQEQLDAAQGKKYIGPELFRWLGMFSHYSRANDVSGYSYQLQLLPPLVFMRILPYQQQISTDLRFRFYSTPNQPGVIFPQMDDIVAEELTHQGVVDVTVTKDACIFSANGQQVEVAGQDILNNLDGYRPEEEFYVNKSTGIYLHQTGSVLRQMVSELDELASGPINSPENLEVIRFCNLRKDEYPGILEKLAAGYQYIEQYDNETFLETNCSLKGISILKGRRFVGSSDIWYHGIAVLNPDDTWTEVTFADHIIHESAHTLLHAYNELEPILYNPFEVNDSSPIRPDPRPIYGTFHATYVFMRLAQFFVQVVKKDESEEVLFRLNRHVKGFYDGMKVIAEYANFTESGYALFEKMYACYQEMRKLYPNPDPEKYTNISRDYVI
jgi:hypothetical protein